MTGRFYVKSFAKSITGSGNFSYDVIAQYLPVGADEDHINTD
jgi:hypothetical protein